METLKPFRAESESTGPKVRQLQDTRTSSKEKNVVFVEFANATRNTSNPYDGSIRSEKENRGENIK